MSDARLFSVFLKPANRRHLSRIKDLLNLRSAGAALNRIIDRDRQQPTMLAVVCPECHGGTITVNTNRFTVCSRCMIAFDESATTIYKIPPVINPKQS